MSIHSDLRALERKLDDLDPDSPEWDRLNAEANSLQEQVNAITDKIEADAKIRNLELRVKSHRARVEAKFQCSYPEWLAFVTGQYTITDDEHGCLVTSQAKKWKQPKEWVLSTELDCYEKLEQLLDYREYDAFRRDRK